MEFETVVGLEVHCQLATATKMFCGATTEFGRAPNTQVDTVTLGLPGVLPVVNAKAVDLALKAALAFGCRIRPRSKFDRKHYFYPDLPKGYQISQYDEPYCDGGAVIADLPDGSSKTFALTRIHMEEDAGKLVHQEHGPWSEVDLNRAGTPLIEIVSEPVLRSGAEAYAYLMELKRTLKAAGVGDCEMQEGSLRCDANVSVRPLGETRLGTKVEIKNLNSFRAVEAAIEHEAGLMTALHRAGRQAEIKQCTKLWDPDAKCTRLMRSKEDAADYRYFPDPDLPPLTVAPERLERLRTELGELPRARQERFQRDFGFERALAAELTLEAPVADYVDALVKAGCKPRLAANWTREEALRLASERKLPLTEAAPLATMAALIRLVDAGMVARVEAKAACSELFAGREAPEAFFTRLGKIQVQDADALSAWVAQAMAQEPKAVADIKAGKLAAAGRLVGLVMKLSGGKADPAKVKVEVLKRTVE